MYVHRWSPHGWQDPTVSSRSAVIFSPGKRSVDRPCDVKDNTSVTTLTWFWHLSVGTGVNIFCGVGLAGVLESNTQAMGSLGCPRVFLWSTLYPATFFGWILTAAYQEHPGRAVVLETSWAVVTIFPSSNNCIHVNMARYRQIGTWLYLLGVLAQVSSGQSSSYGQLELYRLHPPFFQQRYPRVSHCTHEQNYSISGTLYRIVFDTDSNHMVTGFLTECLHSLVAGLAAGLTTDVIEDKEDVMFLVDVDRQLELNLCRMKRHDCVLRPVTVVGCNT